MNFREETKSYQQRYGRRTLVHCFLGLVPKWEFRMLLDNNIISNTGIISVANSDNPYKSKCPSYYAYEQWKYYGIEPELDFVF